MCYEECSMLQRISWHFLQQVHVFNRLAAVGGDDMPAHGLFSFSVLSRIWLQEAGSGSLGSYNFARSHRCRPDDLHPVCIVCIGWQVGPADLQ